jgi:FkbM family methyltransferase
MLKELAKRAFPRPVEMVQSRRFYRSELERGERELRLLPDLVDRHRIAIDVGANNGTYAYYLSKLTKVVAFEPNPRYCWRLSNLPRNVNVQAVALSDKEGEAILHIPYLPSGGEAHGWASLESVPGSTEVRVASRTLDSYGLDPGFIKIDVEGHEEAVVRGAMDTIRQSKPILLIECEERHNPGATLRLPSMLGAIGYRGFFYPAGQERTPITQFDPAIHQPAGLDFENDLDEVRRVYVNNFLFIP